MPISSLMRGRLASLQNEDGGFRAFDCHDRESGMWTTATVVHSLSKLPPAGDDLGWLRRGCDYLVASQNADGGWPFRAAGKSITDITAWCCLALSHYGYDDAIRRGIEFILQARTECNGQEGADCPWDGASPRTRRRAPIRPGRPATACRGCCARERTLPRSGGGGGGDGQRQVLAARLAPRGRSWGRNGGNALLVLTARHQLVCHALLAGREVWSQLLAVGTISLLGNTTTCGPRRTRW